MKTLFFLAVTALALSLAWAGEEAPAPAPASDPLTLRRSLTAKETELSGREADLSRREAQLQEREKILSGQVARYERAIADISKKLKEAQKVQGETADNVSRVYERMEPKRAAQVLNGMEVALASAILSSMKRDQAAAILGLMSPAKARRVTEMQLKGIEHRSPATPETPQESGEGGT